MLNKEESQSKIVKVEDFFTIPILFQQSSQFSPANLSTSILANELSIINESNCKCLFHYSFNSILGVKTSFPDEENTLVCISFYPIIEEKKCSFWKSFYCQCKSIVSKRKQIV